jgi:predicted RNA-binding Zn-ribbon protein involved in translation (DUF1610 family)
MRDALAGKPVEMDAHKVRVHCQKCGSDRVYRLEREGFMQKKIYPLFGYYPWRCKICREHVMLHKRKRAWAKNKEHVE